MVSSNVSNGIFSNSMMEIKCWRQKIVEFEFGSVIQT